MKSSNCHRKYRICGFSEPVELPRLPRSFRTATATLAKDKWRPKMESLRNINMQCFPENIYERLSAYKATQLKKHNEDASTLIQKSIHLLNATCRTTRSDVCFVFNFIWFICGKIFFRQYSSRMLICWIEINSINSFRNLFSTIQRRRVLNSANMDFYSNWYVVFDKFSIRDTNRFG